VIAPWVLDQSGCVPTLPTGYGWGRLGTRLVVPYGAPPGRRVNAVGALAPDDPAGPRLVDETRRTSEGRDAAAAHLAFVRRVAGVAGVATADAPTARPCVVVLDNHSVHHSQAVKDALPDPVAAGVHFCSLPPSRPELTPIEPVWRQVTHHDIPRRSHPTDVALQAAVDTALTDRARRLATTTGNLPRPA